ncbi:MAG: c-type cytochrome [Kordiimonadaceae bacterium]|nr:c-type cytochrome [Kordiimonadaceae bacterium]
MLAKKTVILISCIALSVGAFATSETTPEKAAASGSKAASADFRKDYHRPAEIPYPEDNQFSEAKANLGKMLFFDPRLSKENNISCGSCHNPSFSWEDAQATSVGTPMTRLGRHTPTILNLAWGEVYFWDGRAESMEEQALGPIGAGGEMAQDMEELLIELKEISYYTGAFEEAFPGEGLNRANIGKAIATYERTVVSSIAPFDRWVEGEGGAISDAAKRGFTLFNTKAKCSSCHEGWNFTDWGFHDVGIPGNDEGRYGVIKIDVLKHAFKTPGLRNIVERAPYMHDGSLTTLAQVVDHYDGGFVKRPSLSADIVPLGLSADEKADLVAFLETLSSNDTPVTYPKLPQ